MLQEHSIKVADLKCGSTDLENIEKNTMSQYIGIYQND